jgi:hypothetical protein
MMDLEACGSGLYPESTDVGSFCWLDMPDINPQEKLHVRMLWAVVFSPHPEVKTVTIHSFSG